MAIEYVPDYDEDGVDQGGYTETVPDMPDPDEPDWDDDTEPCGESHCRCSCTTQHGPCGCDCPRDDYGQLTDTDD